MAALPVPRANQTDNFSKWVNTAALRDFQEAAHKQEVLLKETQDAYASSWSRKAVSVIEDVSGGFLLITTVFTGCCFCCLSCGEVSPEVLSDSFLLAGVALATGTIMLAAVVGVFVLLGVILPVSTTIGASLFLLGAATLTSACVFSYFRDMRMQEEQEQKSKILRMEKWRDAFQDFGTYDSEKGVEAISDLLVQKYIHFKGAFEHTLRPSDVFEKKALANCAVLDVNDESSLYPRIAKGLIWNVTAGLRKTTYLPPHDVVEEQLKLAELFLRRHKGSSVAYSELYDLLQRADKEEEISARALATLMPMRGA